LHVSQNNKKSTGVIFVETEDGVVVVKATDNIAIEWFVYHICRIIGVNVPQMRMLSFLEKEHEIMISELERASFHNEKFDQPVRAKLDRPYFLIMEYIPGITIFGMGNIRAARFFNHLTPYRII